MTNGEMAEVLERIAAAYEILGENRFKIIAYSRAADAIGHLTEGLEDIWKRGEVEDIHGVGRAIAGHIDEYFTTGQVRHFDDVFSRIPASVFPLLLVPGIGPKKAYRLVEEFDLKDEKAVVTDLEKIAKQGQIATLEGFGQKSQEVLLQNIEIFRKGQIKENRILLSHAMLVAQGVIDHMTSHTEVMQIDTLGSLRRMVPTIGDIDIAVATTSPEEVVSHFVTYPHQKLVDQGAAGSTILLHNGSQVDLRVSHPDKYGSMLQYFTGSKNHNIRLRSYALEKGMSLSEHGIKDKKTGNLASFDTEEAFYHAIGLPHVPPELREDRGEIDAAIAHKLPELVAVEDIRGDLHMHTDYDFPSSHDIGQSHVHAHLDRASQRGYEYIGISDHNPSITKHSDQEVAEIMKKRKEYYEQQYYSWNKDGKKRVQMILMCEVDILKDWQIALTDSAFEYIDAAVVSLHSAFRMERGDMTNRIIAALESHPKVRIFGHPTGRLLTKRDGVSADWNKIFNVCRRLDIALEINASAERLDLPDTLVHKARENGVKFCIDTDAHHVDGMDGMPLGVSVARRGWATKDDILNTLSYNDFKKWLMKDN